MPAAVDASRSVPTTAESAPRLFLTPQAGSKTSPRIECRRVVTLIGSREGCKVVLPHKRVAPVHTAIINDGTHVSAVDLVTPNGTLLNNLKMEFERLGDGDVLSIGPWELKVSIVMPAGDGASDAHPFALEPTPQVIALEHLATHRILQPTRDACVIGRRRGCDIVITDNSVSRAHALLVSYFGYPAILDLLTRNGTSVNDQPVLFQNLKDDDIISIGDTRFRLRLALPQTGTKSASPPTSTSRNGSASGNGSANGNGSLKLRSPPPDEVADLVDIHAAESSQRWHIVDDLAKAARIA